MAKLPKVQQEVLASVFFQSDAPSEVRERIEADLRRNGRIRETADEWAGLLKGCEGDIASRARMAIRVERTAGALSRQARIFAEPGGAPEFDGAAIGAWLAEIGAGDDERVASLSLDLRDVLARVASRNRGYAKQILSDPQLEQLISVEEMLTRLRPLVAGGHHDWTSLFGRHGLMGDRWTNKIHALAVLHYASVQAPIAERRGSNLQIRTEWNDVPWRNVPRAARERMRGELEPYLEGERFGFGDLCHRATVDVTIPNDMLTKVIYVGRERAAFDTPARIRSPIAYVNSRLIEFQLLALAQRQGARGVEVILYGRDRIDPRASFEIIKVAREMGLGFVVRFMNVFTGRQRFVAGEMVAAKSSDSKPSSYVLPPLRMPKANRMRMIADIVAPEAREERAEVESEGSFSDFYDDAFGGDEEVEDWALRMDVAWHSRDLPGTVQEVISLLMDGKERSITAEEGLARLDSIVWNKLENLFGQLDEASAHLDLVEGDVDAIGTPGSLVEADAASAALGSIAERFDRVRRDFYRLSGLWDRVDNLAHLVHPARRDDLFGDTAEAISDVFGEDYISLEGRLGAMAERIGAVEDEIVSVRSTLERKRDVSEALLSIEGVANDLEAMEEGIGNAMRAAEQRFESFEAIDTSTAEGVASLFDAISSGIDMPRADGNFGQQRGEIAKAKRRLADRMASLSEDDPFRAKFEDLIARLDDLERKLNSAEGRAAQANGAIDRMEKRLASRARGLEEAMPIPQGVDLPPPIDAAHHGSRDVEGRGTLSIASYSAEAMKSKKRFELYLKNLMDARVLVAGGRALLIDRVAAKDVAKWRKARSYGIEGIDLMGRRYSLAANEWGVRMVGVDALPEGHTIRRFIGMIRKLGSGAKSVTRDVFITLANNRGAGEGLDIWQSLISTVLASEEFADTDGAGEEEDIWTSVKLSMVMNGAILSLYDRMSEVPRLKARFGSWFEWARMDSDDFERIRGLSPGILARLDSMTEEGMVDELVESGLIPAEGANRATWIKEWKDGMRRTLKQKKKRARGGAHKAAIERELRSIGKLPEPYIFACVLAERASAENVFIMRLVALEERERRTAKAAGGKMGRMDIARFAMRFIAEHEGPLVRSLSYECFMDEGIDAYEMSPDEIFEGLAGSDRFAGADVDGLVRLGKAYVAKRSAQIAEYMEDAGYLILAAFVDHRDDLAVDALMGSIVRAVSNVARNPMPENPLGVTPAEEIPARSILAMVVDFWRNHESLLDYEPAISESTDAFLAEYGKARGGGGDGGSGSGGGSPPRGPSGTPGSQESSHEGGFAGAMRATAVNDATAGGAEDVVVGRAEAGIDPAIASASYMVSAMALPAAMVTPAF